MQPRLDIATIAVPPQQSVHSKRVTDIVETGSTLTGCGTNPDTAGNVQKRGDDTWVATRSMPFIHKERGIRIDAVSMLRVRVGISGRRVGNVRLHGHDPRFVKLALPNEEDAVVEIHVCEAQRDCFRDPHPGAVQQADERDEGQRP